MNTDVLHHVTKGGERAALSHGTPDTHPRLDAQYAFLVEAEKLKNVLRANQVMERTRFENSGEHSWHACMAALVFAPLANADVDLTHALRMLVLHDIVEIDAGDHPIHISHDPVSVAALEEAAAVRLFGLLPDDIGTRFRAIWDEFEAMDTPTARFAKAVDFLTPALQSVGAPTQDPLEREIVARNLSEGRATKTKTILPALYDFTKAMFEGAEVDPTMAERFQFWCTLDTLKSIDRASRVAPTGRFENTAEHSWHVALYLMVLSDQAAAELDLGLGLKMLLLHDIVEIDAGDNPIHGTVSDAQKAAQAAAEQAAATRIFGLLPEGEDALFRAIWDEFEAAQTPTAKFAKAIDRIPPLFQNLAHEGGSWRDYDVQLAQMETRVGRQITPGAPNLWRDLRQRLTPWFEAQGRL